MTIHENLKELRLARNMTQEQVAEKLNVTRQTVSSYESGRNRPDIDTLVRLSKVYGTDLDALIYGQQKELKATRRVKLAAKIVFALLVVLAFTGSLFYLIANAFFSLPEGGVVSEELTPLFETHWRLVKAWQILDSLVLILSFACFAVLLIMMIVGKGRISLKTKLIYSGILSASLIFIAVVCGLLDPKFSPQEYILTPVFVTVRLMIFLIVDIIIESIKNRKQKLPV